MSAARVRLDVGIDEAMTERHAEETVRIALDREGRPPERSPMRETNSVEELRSLL
jgi:hypothetical protein